METYSKITRIIEPIVSRCSKFRFKAISRTDTLAKLNQISTLESLRFISTTGATGVDEEEARSKVLNSLIDLSAGDLRKSINLSTDHHDEKYNVEEVDRVQRFRKRLEDLFPVRKLSSLLREVGDLDRARKAVGVTAFERIKEAALNDGSDEFLQVLNNSVGVTEQIRGLPGNPIHRWSYQLPFINHFETIHTGPLVSLISHGGLSVGLSLMDSL
ncbi:hypothetical protein BY996DRAFT_8392180 [Phakopsora pachyrhizi]|nr:hypothetical protein BY996DRAFT_8392180 [Phakopsora pachyrhizi]